MKRRYCLHVVIKYFSLECVCEDEYGIAISRTFYSVISYRVMTKNLTFVASQGNPG